MRRFATAIAEVLDWWRLHLCVLAALVVATAVLQVFPTGPWPPMIAAVGLLAGIVAGVLWHSGSGRR
ncbi:MAG: hypothetical protein GC151_01950 [Betaproteobacteria bacterium]|nr:hypothetical protein [Betaproteobacteria bacterium]